MAVFLSLLYSVSPGFNGSCPTLEIPPGANAYLYTYLTMERFHAGTKPEQHHDLTARHPKTISLCKFHECQGLSWAGFASQHKLCPLLYTNVQPRTEYIYFLFHSVFYILIDWSTAVLTFSFCLCLC